MEKPTTMADILQHVNNEDIAKANERPYRKVILLGSAQSTKNEAPVEDKTFEVWGLAWRSDVHNASRLFDIHSMSTPRRVPPNYVEFLTKHNVPVFMQEANPAIPNSLRYPIEQVSEFLRSIDQNMDHDYFASTIAYMLGLAIFERFDEIHMYGIDLAEDEEWSYQRPNAEYLIGLARGLGIKVFIPKKSNLLKFSHRYGYEPWPDEGLVPISEMEKQVVDFRAKVAALKTELNHYQGALQFAEQILTAMRHRARGNKRVLQKREVVQQATRAEGE